MSVRTYRPFGLPADTGRGAREPLDPRSVPLIDGAAGCEAAPAAAPPRCRVPQRLVLAVLLHTGLAVTYAMRVGLSVVAAPPSVAHSNATHPNATLPNATARSNATMYSEFGWSNTDEGVVLGCFFQGYLLTQTLSAVLARRFGGYVVLATAMIASCALTAATPLVAKSFRLLVVCRTSLGLVQGAMYPSTLTLVGKWYTPSERASFLGFIIAGPYLGEALTFPLAAMVMESALGWRFVFYLLAMVGGVWVLLFLGLTASSPEEHPRISREERSLLASALGPSSKAAVAPNPPSAPAHADECSDVELHRPDDDEAAESRTPEPAAARTHCTGDGGRRDGGEALSSGGGRTVTHGAEQAPSSFHDHERTRASPEGRSAPDSGEEGGRRDRRDKKVLRQGALLQDADGGRDVDSSVQQEGSWGAKGGLRADEDAGDQGRREGDVGGVDAAAPASEGRRSAGAHCSGIAQDDSGDADSSIDTEEQAPCACRGKAADSSERRAEDNHGDIPWKAIFTCKAAWACWIGHTVYSWNFYTLLTQLPSYLSLELHLNADEAGWILCMAYLLMLASSVFAGIVADRILISGLVSRSTIRKCAEFLSVLLPAVLLYAGSAVSQPSLSIYLLISAIGMMGFCVAGHHTNYLEISRSLSGILMGIGNTLTCLAGSRSLFPFAEISSLFLPAVTDITIPFSGIAGPIVTGALVDRYNCTQVCMMGVCACNYPGVRACPTSCVCAHMYQDVRRVSDKRHPGQEKVSNCHKAYEQVNLIAVWLCGCGTLFFILCSTSKQVINF